MQQLQLPISEFHSLCFEPCPPILHQPFLLQLIVAAGVVIHIEVLLGSLLLHQPYLFGYLLVGEFEFVASANCLL